MALKIFTTDPAALLKDIKTAINNAELEEPRGEIIDTWHIDKEGDLVWNPSTINWQLNAYFHPVCVTMVEKKYLRLDLYTYKDKTIRIADFAAYHSHFVYELMTHLADKYQRIIVVSDPSLYDDVAIKE